MKLILLAGGFGRKLWPLTRRDFPKPFLKLSDEKSLLRLTLEGYLNHFSPENVFIITEEKYRFLVAEEIGEKKVDVILEPEGRGSFFSVLLAIRLLYEKGRLDMGEPVIVSPSDLFIDSYSKLYEDLDMASAFTSSYISIVGVKPRYTETFFGYALPGMKISNNFHIIEKFVEKPSYGYAQRLIKNGALWNTGIFIFAPAIFLEEIKKIREISKFSDFDSGTLLASYTKLPYLSLPEAVMKRTRRGAVLKSKVMWHSLGSWYGVYESFEKDKNGNVIKGKVSVDLVENSLIFGKERKIVAVDVKNVVVVETRDALFVSSLKKSSRVRDIVDILLQKGEQEVIEHKTVYRPWGSYTVLEEGEGFKVKRIRVKPGQSLSLQYHRKRSEHWIVVTGRVRTEIDGVEKILSSGESTFVPVGKLHRLSNPFDEPAEIIEVQVGSYLGEDDIVRVEDKYGREKDK